MIDDVQFNRIAKALADPRRFELLRLIASNEEVACKAMVEQFPVSQATISHHLKELAIAGLIEPRREGQQCHYSARAGAVEEYLAELERRLSVVRAAR